MKDLVKSIAYPLSERARSPFYGSFVVTWVIWNWRIIFAVAFPSRYDLGGKNLSEFILEKYINWHDCLIIPLYFTGGYILLLPILDWGIIAYTEFWRKLKSNTKNKISGSRLYTGEEYISLNEKYQN